MANQIRRLEAQRGAKSALSDVDLTTIKIPTEEELRNNIFNNKASMLLQYSYLIRDSPAMYRSLSQEAVGVKRDLEYEDEMTRPGETPTYCSHFRTIAPPYTIAPYIHRLLASTYEDLTNPIKRRNQALLNPVIVVWVIAFLAELDIKHLVKERYSSDLYLARAENGDNGNPHWHDVLYSKELGKLCVKLKNELKDYLNELIEEKRAETPLDTEFTLDDTDKASIQSKIKEKFKSCQESIIAFFAGTYFNWNP